MMTIPAAAFLPDGRRVVLLGGVSGQPLQLYTQDIASGETRAFAEPGVSLMSFSGIPVSPDGLQVAMQGPDNLSYRYPVAGGAGVPMTGVNPGERVVRWADDRELYVSNLIGIPQRITRVDLATGRRTPQQALMPSQAAGVRRTELSMTADGRTVLFSYSRLLSDRRARATFGHATHCRRDAVRARAGRVLAYEARSRQPGHRHAGGDGLGGLRRQA
jgi:hypothetical protein